MNTGPAEPHCLSPVKCRDSPDRLSLYSDQARGSIPSSRVRHHGSRRRLPGHAPRRLDAAGERLSGFDRTHPLERPFLGPATSALVRSRLADRADADPRCRSAADPQAAAHPVDAGVHPVGRVLRDARADLRRAHVDLRRRRVRGAVRRRVAHRVQPVDRQPVRLRAHHEPVRRAAPLPAGSPDGRHHHRAHPSRRVHPGRRRGDREVQLGVLHLRRLPGLDRVPSGVPGRRPRRRGQARELHRAAAAPHDRHQRPLRRREAAHRRGRQEDTSRR